MTVLEDAITAAAETVRRDEYEKELRDYILDLTILAHDHHAADYAARRLQEIEANKPADFRAARNMRQADLGFYRRCHASTYAMNRLAELGEP